MASSLRGMQLRLRLLLHGLLAMTALHVHSQRGAAVEALPITSRPIEGNAQLLAWEEWLRLPHEQKTLEKEKKVTAKSIFTLPFRHCPPGHKLYNERCIPHINIDPTDLVKQELLGLVGEGDANNGSPTGNTDYDYSDASDGESDELLFNLPLVPLMQIAQLGQIGQVATMPSAEDQALPSEDAPLKFNIFEKKYPTAPESALPVAALRDALNPTATAGSTSTTTTPSIPTATVMTTPTAMPKIAILREDAFKAQQQPNNRIAEAFQDLQADSTNAVPSTTSLSIPISSSSIGGAFGDIGNIDAIILPAGVPLDAEPSVQLVTSSMSDELDADANADENVNAEADLAQLLKVDAFLPAFGSSSIEPQPPFSHRRVSPPLSADLDLDGGESATDIVPSAYAAASESKISAATATATESNSMQAMATPTTSTSSSTHPRAQEEANEEEENEKERDERKNRLMLKKSKVQPVQMSSTVATTTATSTAKTTTPTTTSIKIATMASRATTTSISTTTAAAAAPTTTTTAAETVAAAEAEVPSIHQDANSNARDDDRFYYQHFTRNVAVTRNSSSTSSSNADGDLDVLNNMASSDNLMTNTIAGQGDSDKVASKINFEQELRIINELVKSKRRLSQLRQQQHEQHPMTSSQTRPTVITRATTMNVGSILDSTSTAATSSNVTVAEAETESTTFWSKLVPMLGITSTEVSTAKSATSPASAAAVAEETAETITPTAATTTPIAGNAAESSIASTATATATAATTTSTTYLSINTNRSNRNSKIIRVDSIVESPITTTPATTSSTTAIQSPTTSNNEDDSYTPFWWLPNIGWRLDRQVDKNGEDRSLLLRFFRTFRANESDTPVKLASLQ